MLKKYNVLFAISEADPLIKIGGLGDVGGTLPIALNDLASGSGFSRVRVGPSTSAPVNGSLSRKAATASGSATNLSLDCRRD